MCYRLIFRTLLFFVISSNLTFGKSEINYVSSSNERPKKPVCDFKAGLARLWHGALQREREITLHTWSTKKKKKAFEMDCWVGSSLAQVVALMAQPLGAGILGLDKTLAGPRISGHWPILGELLSHAVWRTHGLGSTYGHATLFHFTQAWCYRLQSPAQQYQWSWPRWCSFTGKKKERKIKINK